MAILDLLRRRRQDEEDEDEDAGGTEDAVEEPEVADSGGGLLGRLASVPGLGRVLRGGDLEEDAEPNGGILDKLNIVRRLGRVLERGSNDDEEEEESPTPIAVAATPEPPSQIIEASVRVEESTEEYSQVSSGGTGPADGSPPQESAEETPAEGESGTGAGLDEIEEERLQEAQRLRELARSQEDVPAEELAGDLQELLNRINQRR